MKRQKLTSCDKWWRAATSIDIFGERLYLNLDGKESFDTCCGAICTLLIFCILALMGIFEVRLYQTQWAEVPIISTYVKEGFYEQPVEVR